MALAAIGQTLPEHTCSRVRALKEFAMGTGNATVIENIASEQACKTLAIHLLADPKLANGRETWRCQSVSAVGH